MAVRSDEVKTSDEPIAADNADTVQTDADDQQQQLHGSANDTVGQ